MALLLSMSVGVPISTLDDMAMAVADPLDQPLCRGDVELPTRADGDPADMHPGVLPPMGDRAHQVARAEAKPHLLPWDMADGEPVLVRPSHLPRSVAFRPHQQHTLGR